MLSVAQAVLLGLLQGVSELFPISSLGHSVLVPALLGWQLDQGAPQFLAFLVALHVGTGLALIVVFWRDWLNIISGILRSLYLRRIDESDTYAKLGWLLVVGTIPAGILGLLFETELQNLFGAAAFVACLLAFNGVMLWGAELLRKRAERGAANDAALAKLSYAQAFGIGVAQSLALFPGFSRTGAAMTGGLLSGLSHENAARFSFLLSTPIIFAAALLKLPDLAAAGSMYIYASFIGAICAALAAYLSAKFLMRYFKTRTLMPFAIYCICAGLVSLLVIVVR